MWATVKLQNIETKDKLDYKIVGSTESDIMATPPMISNDSPIWKAILWKNKWSTVKLKVPSGNFEYKILEVK
jgi:transcription elongation GreA/GreB family factor